ncbi:MULTISPECIES: demethoxyubiquinone hydroxylase family protein [Gordonibacter]|uniref:Demethoxyubiquinone hydroxylase family protein n=1 Tax=Gordonibacter faecis TaxID=3047475 RepID=A0ABT7DPH5_9ACTN|nr:demethoxyubiquinone hydroxylase family protein [Gordonibacter sp. KGMB12511]MDJ1651433.1 demethoxyubiquinone hydroxylase family protein [Gordonibacter sp. KGMB12511]HIW76025.1 demethoxyubiquinone hydroxylase family protein [Candidatus Gordonibacter avicola]
MPSFANPFAGNVERKMTNAELMQALRLDIAGELEAIYLYESHYLATDDPAAKAVLADIRDEEKAHMGELITLMRHLDPKETEFFLEGEGEVQEHLAELGIITDGEIAPAPAEPAPAPTVGDLS